jgi:hypothetical protein
MEELKKLLGDELFNQVTAKLAGKELLMHDKGQKFIVDDGALIPKHRLDEVIVQRDGFKSQVEQAEKDLKALKSAAKGNEELTAKIEELQEANKAAKAEAESAIRKTQTSFAVKRMLFDGGVINPDYQNLLEKEVSDAELNQDGTVKNKDKYLTDIKAKYAPMFGQTKISGQEHQDGETPGATSKLETELAEAEKTGNTLRVISLKRQIAEETKTKP